MMLTACHHIRSASFAASTSVGSHVAFASSIATIEARSHRFRTSLQPRNEVEVHLETAGIYSSQGPLSGETNG